ncbi:MAG: hypothetical protein IPJ47_22905 [Anaerolineales bacterium]|nr:hypothetical protein [Anaerolineales bacterium]
MARNANNDINPEMSSTPVLDAGVVMENQVYLLRPLPTRGEHAPVEVPPPVGVITGMT